MVSKRLLSLPLSISLSLSLFPISWTAFSQESRMKVTYSVLVTFFEEERVHTPSRTQLLYIYIYKCTRENNDTSATLGDYFKVNLLRSSTTHFALNSFISSCAWWKFSACSIKLKKKKRKNKSKNKTYSESKNWLCVELVCHLLMFVVQKIDQLIESIFFKALNKDAFLIRKIININYCYY